MAQNYLQNKEPLKAFAYLKKTMREDPVGEYGRKASLDLTELEKVLGN
jgi:outer membrane protein assembly factor BamD (BamD/ComL family)